VRPGSDGALALGIAGEMIRNNWFDADFVRNWPTDPCWFVATLSGSCALANLLLPPVDAQPKDLLAWDAAQDDLVAYSIPQRIYARSCKLELDASVELFSAGGNHSLPMRLWPSRKRQTRSREFAVDRHSARAAGTVFTAQMHPGQTKIFARKSTSVLRASVSLLYVFPR
jgi:anaerobic selenocysteine-containing dehydrogenase